MPEVSPEQRHVPSTEQFEHGVDADIVDNEATDPQYIEDDPEYQQMYNQENFKYKEIWGTPEFDLVELGDPNDPSKKSMKERVIEQFRAANPEKAQYYQENENKRRYDRMSDDPAYRKMMERAIVQTNSDNPRSTDSWNRSYSRETFFARQDFAVQYPEKAQLYANDFEYYAEHYPELKKITDLSQWDQWCNDHPEARDLNESRALSWALEAVKSRKEIAKKKKESDLSKKELAAFRKEQERVGVLEESDGHLGTILDTPIQEAIEKTSDLIYQHMRDSLQSLLPENLKDADDETLRQAQKGLKEIPYIQSQDSKDLTDAIGIDEGTMLVQTDKIIGSVSPAFENWSSQYDGRPDLVINIAKKLMHPTDESLENVFHLKESEKGGVKLKKIQAPEGDMFFVVDGTHRVAGSKLAQTPEIPAQVEKLPNVTEAKSRDSHMKYGWERMIKMGLIKGTIHESIDDKGFKEYSLKIEKQVLPWLHLSQGNILKMNKIYRDKFPKAFASLKTIDGKKIPEEAMTDEIAFNAFSVGRFEDYKKVN